MDFLFSIPYLPHIVGLAVLVFVYQRFAHRVRVRVPGVQTTSFDDVLGKVLGSSYTDGKRNRQIAAYKKQGQYLAAGKILEDVGRLPEAADVYVEGQELFAAASILEKLGRLDKAAEYYLESGDSKKAANVFIAANKPAKAAQLFLEKGNSLEAARLFGVAGQWDKAADLFAKGGYPLRAAEAYEKKEEWLKAAECYEKHFMENVSFSTTYSSTTPTSDQKSARQAGQLYAKAGALPRALQIYSRGGYFKEAADVCLQQREYAKAAELYLRAEDSGLAADAYEKGGDRVKAANLRGEVALRQERIPDAARFFHDGQDYQRAAELFEQVGMLSDAAGAYEAAESWAAAGGVYIRAGHKDLAAQCYERAGELETAAKLYEEAGQATRAIPLFEKAGLTFKSGEAAAVAGDRDRAIALLQRVVPTDENYRPATEILVRLFLESGRAPLALERVQKAIAGQPVSAANIDLYYWLALAQEADQPREAISVYKKIQSESLGFRDVEARVAALEAGRPLPGLSSSARPAAAPAAAPAPPAAVAAPIAAARPVAPGPVPAAAPVPAPAAKAPAKPRFVPREELGKGRLGAVFRAEDQLDGRSVALRVLPAAVLAGKGVLASLAADLKAAAALSHPNGVKVLGFVERDGQRCVVTEFVQGRQLGDALKSGHKMSVQQAHGLGRVVAQYLSFIHGKGLVHGCIQPSNVMVAAGVLKIADLGLGRLAQLLPADDDYRAPEAQLDVAGDLYALAAVLYHLLTGIHPRKQSQGAALPLPSTYSQGVPEALDKLLVRALHPRVELRFASADEVLGELKNMVRLA
ncbi:MAG TPA: protein kinase [Vicinamibacteria bacterium]|nr:protein kinase [Vicinamibacteria bacterium]